MRRHRVKDHVRRLPGGKTTSVKQHARGGDDPRERKLERLRSVQPDTQQDLVDFATQVYDDEVANGTPHERAVDIALDAMNEQANQHYVLPEVETQASNMFIQTMDFQHYGRVRMPMSRRGFTSHQGARGVHVVGYDGDQAYDSMGDVYYFPGERTIHVEPFVDPTHEGGVTHGHTWYGHRSMQSHFDADGNPVARKEMMRSKRAIADNHANLAAAALKRNDYESYAYHRDEGRRYSHQASIEADERGEF
jgi:hypothetical protein